MSYAAPVADMSFALRQIAGLEETIGRGLFGDLGMDLVEAILVEAGKFATEEIAPLNQPGDAHGAPLKDGAVVMPEGWKQVYEKWCEAGWASLPCPEAYGGQALPHTLATAAMEMWNQATMAFGIGPVLTHGAVAAIAAHASEELKQAYLPKMVSGEWMGTMNLTEPQAGTDLGLMRTKAQPGNDGTHMITGTKIFITYGDHELTDNIIHLVLARLPDAPPGTRGISLFLVPKYLLNEDGTPGERNDVRCVSVEEKLGIHASPTCVMSYGDDGGATGYLVGEENRGLACMFTMMNDARLAVGIQGVAIAERAYQQALSYAQERRQGRAPGTDGAGMSPIIEHPDIRRNLLTMRAMTQAARAICYATAAATDAARHEPDEKDRKAAQLVANLLTPVAKAFSTDIGVEVASIGVQVHGGMGYIEETGAAQHLRDARIAPIYEGTNGIQAIDLVVRKLGQEDGAVVRGYIAGLRDLAEGVMGRNEPAFGRMGYRLNAAVDELEQATLWLLDMLQQDEARALAGATPYLRLFGLAAGGAYLARGALASSEEGTEDLVPAGRIAIARYFAENHLPETAGLRHAVTEGGDAVLSFAPEALAL